MSSQNLSRRFLLAVAPVIAAAAASNLATCGSTARANLRTRRRSDLRRYQCSQKI